MQRELEGRQTNGTFTAAEAPVGRFPIGEKWISRFRADPVGESANFEVSLIVIAFSYPPRYISKHLTDQLSFSGTWISFTSTRSKLLSYSTCLQELACVFSLDAVTHMIRWSDLARFREDSSKLQGQGKASVKHSRLYQQRGTEPS